MGTKLKFVVTGGWNWVKEAALTTIHKSSIEGKEISSEWKRGLLKSEHSPIRELSIRFKISEIKRWISDQIVRHKHGVEHYVGTMRSDRGSKPREEQWGEKHKEQLYMLLHEVDIAEVCSPHRVVQVPRVSAARFCVRSHA